MSTNTLQMLKEKFENIKNSGYHQGINNFKNAGGTTLEYLLESTGGCFNIPDFYDIEIKAINKFCNNHIDLFNCAPDGGIVNGIKWISERFGYPDRDYKNINVLKGNVYANKLSKIGSTYLFKLKIDEIQKRIYLNIIDYQFRLINNDIYWDFNTLEDKLVRKDSNLALFEFYRKNINGNYYYKYTNLSLYKLKDFKQFINSIKNGKIYLVIKTGVIKNGKFAGNFKNHGTSFRICIHNINKLYIKIT